MHMRRGFTLLELSIVMAIIAVIIGGAMVMVTVSVKQTAYNATLNTMNAIDQALVNYSAAQFRLPCPGDLTLLPSNANYGVEAANPGTCTGGTPAVTNNSGGVVEGAVPTRTLRLPDSYMYDGWGRHIRYAVDSTYTSGSAINGITSGISLATGNGTNNSLPPPAGGTCGPSSSAITVQDAAGSTRSASAVYILLSHGANGHGAYTMTGGATMFNAKSTNANELTNCHCTSGAASGTYGATYVQQAPTNGTAGSLLTAFDDVLVYRENWQLRSASTPFIPFACMYMVDFNIWNGDTNGLLTYYPTSQQWVVTSSNTVGFTAGNTTSSGSGVTLDSSGDVFVSNFGQYTVGTNGSGAVYKYTKSSGTWSTFISGAGNSVNAPSSISIDKSDVLYVTMAASNGYNVVKYSSSTANTVLGTLTDGFSNPQMVSLDSSGTIWVADGGNNTIKYNNGSWNALTGTFSLPTGVFMDGSNNVWVVDENNNRVQKCNKVSSAHNCTNASDWTITGGTSPGTAPAQFSDPTAVVGDYAGNVYVGDGYNRRIQMWDGTKWSVYAVMTFKYAQYFPAGLVTVGGSPFIGFPNSTTP